MSANGHGPLSTTKGVLHLSNSAPVSGHSLVPLAGTRRPLSVFSYLLLHSCCRGLYRDKRTQAPLNPIRIIRMNTPIILTLKRKPLTTRTVVATSFPQNSTVFGAQPEKLLPIAKAVEGLAVPAGALTLNIPAQL
jgi:hypothetical protein